MGDRKDEFGGRKRANTNGHDDEFDYGEAFDQGRLPAGATKPKGRVEDPVGLASGKTTLYANRPYDEAVELSDAEFDESVDTHALSSSNAGGVHSPPAASSRGVGRTGPSGALAQQQQLPSAPTFNSKQAVHDSPPAISDSMDERGEYASDMEIPGAGGSGGYEGGLAAGRSDGGGEGEDVSHSDVTSPPPEGAVAAINPGIVGVPPKKLAYNPDDFAGLAVGDDIRTLFEHIGAYRPRNVELETRIMCFIPEFIPAIGEIDAFLKPPRPDGAEEKLGLAILDEPSATQSDPTVLDMQLRALSKKAGVEPMLVRSIENADKNSKEITKWIQNVADVHKSKPPPAVHYAKPMPDVEKLMQEWPPAFEDLLKDARLPGADLDLSVDEYARHIAAILDIPVYSSVVQSMHVMFTLYNEFQSNQHFANMNAATEASAQRGTDATVNAVDALLNDDFDSHRL